MPTERILDLSGLNCPLPILRAKKALAGMESGTVLQVIATDPGAPGDFAAFCRQTGNVLLESGTTDEGKFKLVLQRK
jgi:tRNA 2-thiouridine synthesizing protein A